MFSQRLVKIVSTVIACVALLALPWIAKPFGEGLKARIDGCSEAGFPAFHDYERDIEDVALPTSGSTTTMTPEFLTTPEVASPTAHVDWATWTATAAGTATSIATSTMALPAPSGPPSPLLDRLADDKPSIWGDKRFYVLLGLIYIILSGLFVKQVISIARGRS
jgi:hypothetical protein